MMEYLNRIYKYLYRHQNLTIAGIFFLMLALIIFRELLTGQYLFAGGDTLSAKAVGQGMELSRSNHGNYPLWLPWIFSGLPATHSFQYISRFYFPHHLFIILKSIGLPWFWTFLFHYVFAGLGGYKLLRQLGTDRISALFGGSAFMLTPYMITMIVHGHGSQMMTSAFIPWIILTLIKLLNNPPNLRNLGMFALLTGLQLQRAHAQIVYYTWLMMGLLIVIYFIDAIKNRKEMKSFFLVSISLFLSLGMAISIYWPASSYAPFSIRGGAGGKAAFDYATQWSFSFGEIITFFIPSFFGFGGATYWGNMPFTDFPNYMGILVISIAIMAVFKNKSIIKWVLLITTMFALTLSFGKNIFIYKLFYDYFPYFSKFRIPSMFLILVQFSVAILAGLGLHQLRHQLKSDTMKKWVNIVFSVAIGLSLILMVFGSTLVELIKIPQTQYEFLNNMRRDLISSDLITMFVFIDLFMLVCFAVVKKWINIRYGFYAILFLSIIDLGIVDRKIIKPAKESYRTNTIQKSSFKKAYLKEDEIIHFLKEDRSIFRVLPVGHLMNDNRWAAFNIESVGGYHPAKLENMNQIMNVIGFNSLGILQMLNVKYLISLEPLSHPAFTKVFTGKLFFGGKYQTADIYHFEYALSRAYFIEKLQTVEDELEQINILKQPSFSPISNSFITDSINLRNYNTDQTTIEIISKTPDEVTLRSSADSDQFMVISEIYYPEGWSATIDGKSTLIHEVNGVLRGIEVTAGVHMIVMEFAPEDIKYGLVISWVSMLIIFGLLTIPVFRKK